MENKTIKMLESDYNNMRLKIDNQEDYINHLEYKLKQLKKENKELINNGYNFEKGRIKANIEQGMIAFGVTSLIIFVMFIGFYIGGII